MDITNLAPICLFTYNRLAETKQTLETLQRNFLAPQSDLYVFSDGWKNEKAKEEVLSVRAFLKTITGFKNIYIIESKTNRGLANSIISGVNLIFKNYETVIVLEDDLITSPNFLNYMNQALYHYRSTDKIQSISGYSVAINSEGSNYIFNRTFPWGWATWKHYWHENIFDPNSIKKIITANPTFLKGFRKKCGDDVSKMLLDSLSERNNSWYIKWVFNHYLNKNFALFPRISKVTNIGYNGTGTHCNAINTYQDNFIVDTNIDFAFLPFDSLVIETDVLEYFSVSHKIKHRIKLLLTGEGRRALFEEIREKINGK
ncbi:glycosyltransferase [Parapedobacter tibetensis]|uniref:glycosyltransferase n=1 Tax=Parapedobacter tibetensis TaxID=2972951 RepID=UPI00214DD780|nr:glycosyltransferase [Parapedobacter tibetensis]